MSFLLDSFATRLAMELSSTSGVSNVRTRFMFIFFRSIFVHAFANSPSYCPLSTFSCFRSLASRSLCQWLHPQVGVLQLDLASFGMHLLGLDVYFYDYKNGLDTERFGATLANDNAEAIYDARNCLDGDTGLGARVLHRAHWGGSGAVLQGDDICFVQGLSCFAKKTTDMQPS